VGLCRRRYGIGQIYLRQEKWAEAHYHFRTAAAINKRSSVLHCYTGMALHRQGLHAEALQCLQVRASRQKSCFSWFHPPLACSTCESMQMLRCAVAP
jgi:predicted Zn-dependent protease